MLCTKLCRVRSRRNSRFCQASPFGRVAFTRSTSPPNDFVIKGASGGGGGGGGAEGRAGAPGSSSPWEERDIALEPGSTYVVLIGAAGLGGAGQGLDEHRGRDGDWGGVSAILGRNGFVCLLGAGPANSPKTSASQSNESALQRKPSEPVTREEQAGSDSSRFAIVDASGQVDNVIRATATFFQDALVQELALEHRIELAGDHETLKRRSVRAVPIQLRDDERVSPGWYFTSTVGGATDAPRFIEPANNPLPLRLRGTPGGKGAVRRRLTDERISILAVATEWSSAHGGVSTVNRSLCIALARKGHRVFCLVPHGVTSAQDHQRANAQGVSIVEAPPTTGKDLGTLSGLLRKPVLGDDRYPDLIIAHGHVTGAAGQILRQEFFPLSSCVQLIHTQPGESEWYKQRDKSPAWRVEASEAEGASLAQAAAVVAGIGPRLTRQAWMYVHGLPRSPLVTELTPGLEDWEEGANATPPPEVRCLFIGRAEDAQLKGLDIATDAVARMAREMSVGQIPTLVIRGASPGTGGELHASLKDRFPSPHHLRVLEFTTDEAAVRRTYRESSVVLMPSRTEGFGLVALEAVSAGIPLLVAAESGFAELLQRDYAGYYDDFVVQWSANNAVSLWALRITDMLKRREHFFSRVRELRTAIMATSTWERAADALIATARAIPPEISEVGGLRQEHRPHRPVSESWPDT